MLRKKERKKKDLCSGGRVMNQNLEPCFQIQILLSTSSAPKIRTYKMKELG